MATFSDEDLIDIFSKQLPDLLERRPELEPLIYNGFLKAFVRREEVAVILEELRALRDEVNQRFEQVDQRFEQTDDKIETLRDDMNQRFEQVDQKIEEFRNSVEQRFEEVNQRFSQVDERMDSLEHRMETGFKELLRAIDRLGARWGIRNETVFRETIATLLEESFGVKVEQRVIQGEQLDVVIYDHQHVLVEISASTSQNMGERLERKRRLYTEDTGIAPTRVILATAAIHSRHAQALRNKGIEVIEPDPPYEEEERD